MTACCGFDHIQLVLFGLENVKLHPVMQPYIDKEIELSAEHSSLMTQQITYGIALWDSS